MVAFRMLAINLRYMDRELRSELDQYDYSTFELS